MIFSACVLSTHDSVSSPICVNLHVHPYIHTYIIHVHIPTQRRFCTHFILNLPLIFISLYPFHPSSVHKHFYTCSCTYVSALVCEVTGQGHQGGMGQRGDSGRKQERLREIRDKSTVSFDRRGTRCVAAVFLLLFVFIMFFIMFILLLILSLMCFCCL